MAVPTRRRIAFVLATIVAVATVATISSAVGAEPLLKYGGASWVAQVEDRPMADDGEPVYGFAFKTGGTAEWAVQVQNSAFVPVTIRGATRLPDGFRSLVADAELHVTDGSVVDADSLPAFKAFELAPGASAFLLVTQRFVLCANAAAWYEPGTGIGLDDLDLDVSVLGITRRTTLDLPFHLVFDAPTSSTCF